MSSLHACVVLVNMCKQAIVNTNTHYDALHLDIPFLVLL